VRVCTSFEAAGAGKLIFLTVPDDAIESVCNELSAAEAFPDRAIVAHCSGALSSDVLASAREQARCMVGSMHPLHTFPSVEAAAAKWRGTYCFCEGDEPAVTMLQRLAQAIGSKPVRIDRRDKAVYHAATVMACNYVTALMDAALTLATSANIDRRTAWAAMERLVRSTVENISEMGSERALTGPIVRGDLETVRRHLNVIKQSEEGLDAVYRTMGQWTVRLAKRKGTLNAQAIRNLLELLESSATPAGGTVQASADRDLGTASDK